MNYEHEIYKRENLPYDEWSRIEHEAGHRNHTSFDKHQKDFLEKQKLEQELTDRMSWEDYQHEQETAFINGEIETQ